MATAATTTLAEELFAKLEERLARIEEHVVEKDRGKETMSDRRTASKKGAGAITAKDITNSEKFTESMTSSIKQKLTDFIPDFKDPIVDETEEMERNVMSSIGRITSTVQSTVSSSLDLVQAGIDKTKGVIQPLAMTIGAPEFVAIPETLNTIFRTVRSIGDTIHETLVDLPETIHNLWLYLLAFPKVLWSTITFPFKAVWGTIKFIWSSVKFIVGTVKFIHYAVNFLYVWLQYTIPAMFSAIKTWLVGTVVPIVAALGMYLLPIMGLITLLTWIFWDEIVGAIKWVYNWAKDIEWKDIKNVTVKTWKWINNKLWPKIKDVFVKMRKGWEIFKKDRIEALKQLWNNWHDYVNNELVPAIGKVVLETEKAIWNWILKPLGNYLWNELIHPLYSNHIQPVLKPIWNAISPLVKWVWDMLKPAIDWVWKRLKPVIFKIWEFINPMYQRMKLLLVTLREKLMAKLYRLLNMDDRAETAKTRARYLESLKGNINRAIEEGDKKKLEHILRNAKRDKMPISDHVENLARSALGSETFKMDVESESAPELESPDFSQPERRETANIRNGLQGIQNEVRRMREENRKSEKEKKESASPKGRVLTDKISSLRSKEMFETEQISNGTVEVND